jgi:hypothetical protein
MTGIPFSTVLVEHVGDFGRVAMGSESYGDGTR